MCFVLEKYTIDKKKYVYKITNCSLKLETSGYSPNIDHFKQLSVYS